MTSDYLPVGATGPSILSAMWRYRWLVLLIVVLAIAGGIYWQERQEPVYTATASLVVDPQTATIPGETTSTPNASRFLADQVVILRSPRVAERAAEIVAEAVANPPFALTAPGLQSGAEIVPAGDSNLISIRFVAEAPDVAVLGANTLAVGYQDVRRADLAANAAAAIERLDTLIASIDEDLAAIAAEIDVLRTGSADADDPVLSALEEQLAASLQELVDLQEERANTTDPEELTRIRQSIDDIAQQISLFTAVRSLDQGTPEAQGLLADQAAAIQRRSQLRERRDELAVDAELISSGVTSFLPAQGAAALGSANLLRTLIAMIVFGGLIGAGLAYLLSLRRRDFADRSEPEAMLNAPLLADIPDFREERIKSELPVRTHSRSVASEAFRFGIAALDVRMPLFDAHSVGLVSGVVGDGKSTLAANLALVASRQGTRVLLVDADFGAQALSRLLDPSGDYDQGELGMTDVAAGTTKLSTAVRRISVADPATPGQGGDGVVHLLSRGTAAISAVDFFRAEPTRALFQELRDVFDIVIIDMPPLLQVAYASVVARSADVLAVVVPHGSRFGELEELTASLRLIDRPIAGYFYNRAPLREEMLGSAGSMQDILGDRNAAGGRPADGS